MINANELRIGNLIKYIASGQWVEVNGDVMIGMIENGFEEFCPINLTPEILEKCGFQPFQKNNFFKSYITIDDRGDGNWVVAEFDQVDGNIHLFRNTIKYLHQLQNLYFALAGEELKLNL
jgi:hypothetical protein